MRAGFALQLVGLVAAIASLVALGRSFGFVAADRGLVTRGPQTLYSNRGNKRNLLSP